MNYFDVFDMAPHFGIDIKALKLRYYALSKTVHPDYHTQATTTEQEAALEQSTLVNQAYKTLSNPNKLLKYMLELHDLIVEEQGNNIPQDFLMEMMDLNEAIMDLQMDPDAEKQNSLKSEIGTLIKSLDELGSKLKQNFDENQSIETLIDLKDYYFKRKYLMRLSENIMKLDPA